MGLLDGMLSGLVGGQMATVVSELIERHGGVQGIVAQMEQRGFGDTVNSWVGNGTNRPISAAQVHSAFGGETIAALAATIGLHPQDLAQKLAQALPQAINKLTPGGVVQSG